MLKKLPISLFVLLVLFVSITFSQPPQKNNKIQLIDEFSNLANCDYGNRIDNLLIQLTGIPESQGYILFYRGAKDKYPNHSEKIVKRNERRLISYIRQRGFDSKRIKFIDAGFQNVETFYQQLWIVPKGINPPKPKNTVSKPKIPTNRPFLADFSTIGIYEASFEFAKEQIENELIEYEFTVNELIEKEEDPKEKPEEFFNNFVSNFFVDQLEKNKDLTGVIFFYLDVEEYHLGKAEEFLRSELKLYGEKYKADLSRVRLVYGGYRKDTEAEFWIVSQNAPDPVPTPEIKKIKE